MQTKRYHEEWKQLTQRPKRKRSAKKIEESIAKRQATKADLLDGRWWAKYRCILILA
jgi:hypothetical protein